MPTFERRIHQAVLVRENGNPVRAAITLEGLELQAANKSDYVNQARALSQRIVCYQILSEFGKNRTFLVRMQKVSKEGLTFATNQPEVRDFGPIFEHRLGIACLRLGELNEALAHFQSATDSLQTTDDKYPEFQAYLGLANVYLHHESLGQQQLDKAWGTISDAELPPEDKNRWIWMVHSTGILLRIAEADIMMNRFDAADATLDLARPLVHELHEQHGKPYRLAEYKHFLAMIPTVQ